MESVESCIAKSMMGSKEPRAFGLKPWTSPALEDLLPQLSLEEQLRLQGRLRERERKLKRMKSYPREPSMLTEGMRDAFLIEQVQDALRFYNTRHPDDKFDAVKPLMEASAGFRDQLWYHVNFWARSRKSNKIKRFFAEVHYKPATRSSVSSDTPIPVPEAAVHDKPPTSSSSGPKFRAQVPIVEVCTIIEEPLNRYRRSCAFCPANRDILHPLGSRKFVCGNDKDRFVQQIRPCKGDGWLGMPFTNRSGPEEEERHKI